jgi:hypothetical protein
MDFHLHVSAKIAFEVVALILAGLTTTKKRK